MDEKRFVSRLSNYWERLRLTNQWEATREQRILPDYARFNTASIEDIWQNCILLREQSKAPEGEKIYVYSHIGNKLKDNLPLQLINQPVNSRMRDIFAAAAVTDQASEAVKNKKPIEDFGQFINKKSKLVKYRSCLLPFGTEDGDVTHIVIGVTWRDY